MSLISELKKPASPHPCQEILSHLNKARTAKHLGIHYSYLVNVLNGTRVPGKFLEQRIQTLAEEVAADLKKQ